jgi:hypothetical protein
MQVKRLFEKIDEKRIEKLVRFGAPPVFVGFMAGEAIARTTDGASIGSALRSSSVEAVIVASGAMAFAAAIEVVAQLRRK